MLEDAVSKLGLQREASADEVRQAYRDLVKVWHPDRFGDDVRLRAKAEEQLKEINAAYRTLEAAGFRTGLDSVRSVAGAPTRSEDSSSYAAESRPTAAPQRVLRAGLYAGSAVLLAGMAVFAIHPLRSAMPSPRRQLDPAAPMRATGPKKEVRTRRPAELGAGVPGVPAFQVRPLSQADSDRVQMACSAQAPGTDAYRSCMAAQLRAVAGSSVPAQISGMSRTEREAAEAACGKNASDSSAYQRCLKQQVAAVAAEPLRPDLSGMNEADRSAIEKACGGSRRRGAADYDRCLTRFARTLESARP